MARFEVVPQHGFGVEYRPKQKVKQIIIREIKEEPDPEFEKFREQYLERLRKIEEKRNRTFIDMETLLD